MADANQRPAIVNQVIIAKGTPAPPPTGSVAIISTDGVTALLQQSNGTTGSLGGLTPKVGAALTGAASQTINPFTDTASSYSLNGGLLGVDSVLLLGIGGAPSANGPPATLGLGFLVTIIVVGSTAFKYTVQSDIGGNLAQFGVETLNAGVVARYCKFYYAQSTAHFGFFTEWGYLQGG